MDVDHPVIGDPQAHATCLQETVNAHKAAIGHHRRRLKAAKSALAAFEAFCRRRGIKIILVQKQPGEGDIHGRHPARPATDP